MAKSLVAGAAFCLHLFLTKAGDVQPINEYPHEYEEVSAFCCARNQALNKVIHHKDEVVRKLTFYGLQGQPIRDVEVEFTNGAIDRLSESTDLSIPASTLMFERGEELPEVQMCMKQDSLVSFVRLGKDMSTSCWRSWIMSFPETDGRILTGVISRFDKHGVHDFGVLLAKQIREATVDGGSCKYDKIQGSQGYLSSKKWLRSSNLYFVLDGKTQSWCQKFGYNCEEAMQPPTWCHLPSQEEIGLNVDWGADFSNGWETEKISLKSDGVNRIEVKLPWSAFLSIDFEGGGSKKSIKISGFARTLLVSHPDSSY